MIKLQCRTIKNITKTYYYDENWLSVTKTNEKHTFNVSSDAVDSARPDNATLLPNSWFRRFRMFSVVYRMHRGRQTVVFRMSDNFLDVFFPVNGNATWVWVCIDGAHFNRKTVVRFARICTDRAKTSKRITLVGLMVPPKRSRHLVTDRFRIGTVINRSC